MSALRLILTLGVCVAAMPAYADDPVNYDDPNLAMTNEFVGDTAAACPAELSAFELAKCLREKHLAPQGVAKVPTPDSQTTQR